MTPKQYYENLCRSNETTFVSELRHVQKEVEKLSRDSANLLHRVRLRDEHYRRAHELERAQVEQKVWREIGGDPLINGILRQLVSTIAGKELEDKRS